MPDMYTVPGGNAAVTSALKSAVAIEQPAAFRTRPRVTRIQFGYNGTPADNAFKGEVRRLTAAGTNTAVTPEPNDPGAPASNIVGASDFSAEPTTGNLIFNIPQAQRTTYLEVFDLQDAPVVLGANLAGIALRTLHASYTGASNGKITYWE